MGIHGAAPINEAVLELPQRRVDGVLRRPPRAVGHHIDGLRRRHLAVVLEIVRDGRWDLVQLTQGRGGRRGWRRRRGGKGRGGHLPEGGPLEPPAVPDCPGPGPAVQLRTPLGRLPDRRLRAVVGGPARDVLREAGREGEEPSRWREFGE